MKLNISLLQVVVEVAADTLKLVAEAAVQVA